MTSHELTCKEVVELVTAYLEGALDDADARRFEEHLADCDGCSGYLDQMRRTIKAVGLLAEEDVPAPVMDDLVSAFRAWRRA